MAYRWIYRTPDGFSDLLLTGDGESLTGLCFLQSRDAERKADADAETERSVFAETIGWLEIYFGGGIPDFTPRYRIEGLTDFRRAVTEIMLSVPYGETVTYGEIAKALAAERGLKRMSAQAVGGAVGWNPLCLIVPCHRVIGKNGALTGYGGGMQNKIALLRLEGHEMWELRGKSKQ
ncbi:MAG: methylated-DNA--[protein]-cysteine S-methyltransferase [Clostridia bacterium]|nr:methylated-DNA--[protein]-cysteine S-methyltransferase [Clostridia bacterium]